MSHELKGRVPGRPKDQCITLNINGLQRRTTHIYTALNAEQFNRLDSGSGDTKHYTRSELIAITNNKEVWSKLKTFEQVFILALLEHCLAPGIEITFA
jgi:hypothetical protein